MSEVQSVNWCSLFCTGNEAIGDMSLRLDDDVWIDVPVCEKCLVEIQKNQKDALARILGT